MIMAVGLWQAVTEGGEQGQADSGGGSGSDWLSGSVGKSGEEAGQVPVPPCHVRAPWSAASWRRAVATHVGDRN